MRTSDEPRVLLRSSRAPLGVALEPELHFVPIRVVGVHHGLAATLEPALLDDDASHCLDRTSKFVRIVSVDQPETEVRNATGGWLSASIQGDDIVRARRAPLKCVLGA